MQTVMITGSNRGLGLEFARQYGADGWRVMALARSSSAALEEIRLGNKRVTVYPLDVADHRQIEHLGRQLASETIDVLVNNAGVYGGVPFSDGGVEAQSFGRMDYEDWMRTLRINLFGPLKMAEAFAANVERSKNGRIVTITSELGSTELNRLGGIYGYRASKAAVNAVMKSMSIDLAKRGVLAIALHPGWARTAMGGDKAPVEVTESVAGMRSIIDRLSKADLGKVIAYDGSVLPY